MLPRAKPEGAAERLGRRELLDRGNAMSQSELLPRTTGPSTPSGAPAASFVVRLWTKQGAESAGCHGQIVHVQSGETAYFAHEAKMLTFISDHATTQLLKRGKRTA